MKIKRQKDCAVANELALPGYKPLKNTEENIERPGKWIFENKHLFLRQITEEDEAEGNDQLSVTKSVSIKADSSKNLPGYAAKGLFEKPTPAKFFITSRSPAEEENREVVLE